MKKSDNLISINGVAYKYREFRDFIIMEGHFNLCLSPQEVMGYTNSGYIWKIALGQYMGFGLWKLHGTKEVR